MMKKHILWGIMSLLTLTATAQEQKLWTIEAEDATTKVVFSNNEIEMWSPKGLTLWRNELMQGDCIIEYEAQVVEDKANSLAGWADRLSDLNCFWKASDPKSPSKILARKNWRKGKFERYYTMQMYYLGYGGNSNTTTRFRRYTGDERGVAEQQYRPNIIKEYTDNEHLLRPNHWYKVRIECTGNRVRYWIDGECLMDYRDPQVLKDGWFGFRTTQSHCKLRNFVCQSTALNANSIPLHWIGDQAPAIATACTWGVPFPKGKVKDTKEWGITNTAVDSWPLAKWPDGSIKWAAYSAIIPANETPILTPQPTSKKGKQSVRNEEDFRIHYGSKTCLWDSITIGNRKVAGTAKLIASTTKQQFTTRIDSVRTEREGDVRRVIKICGTMEGWLPFVVRAYIYKGSGQLQLVHTFIYDGDQNKDFINSLGLDIEVPMDCELYNRHVAFTDTKNKVWSESVQPLVGRRDLNPDHKWAQVKGERIPALSTMSQRDQQLIADWATWDRFRLSQLTDMGYTIRKQATQDCAFIGTQGGSRASGFAFIGTTEQGLAGVMRDFWQSCPSTIEITQATTDTAHLTFWLWSPESEPMDLRHYDKRAHGLNASYEDVQEGLSTPYGIARTTEFLLNFTDGFHGREQIETLSQSMTTANQLACTPEYLHEQKAFGVWSLPHRDTPSEQWIENRLDSLLDLYTTAVDEEHWYGFWNYGDVMHTTDPSRGGWLYDVGGYAWDNTELGTNMWLWYSFLRTGRKDLWTMARAMTRHNSEVDVYHKGDLAGLGTRHNVSHWGCGAKEARISQALWNRFMYFLTADERLADLMDEVTDADQRLYTLDPMRLAQPRELYPCTAPARLRIGPDWLSYAGNWLSRWERTGDTSYKKKIETGMQCISQLHDGIFTGPQALGYYPDSGKITCETDTAIHNTNHLLSLMGGFEFVNELEETLPNAAWHRVWLDHNARYKAMAKKISNNTFRIPRLAAYAYYHTGDKRHMRSAWSDLRFEPWTEFSRLSTNDAARWSLDAIYIQEVCPWSE